MCVCVCVWYVTGDGGADVGRAGEAEERARRGGKKKEGKVVVGYCV